VHTTHAVLHARHITLPDPKRGGLLNMNLIKSIKSPDPKREGLLNMNLIKPIKSNLYL
jgi:hypothetical protein